MPIHIPHLMEPYQGTAEQWKAYLAQQSAGHAYAIAYSDTIGILALFSRRKAKALSEARRHYYRKVDDYYKTLDK